MVPLQQLKSIFVHGSPTLKDNNVHMVKETEERFHELRSEFKHFPSMLTLESTFVDP